MAVCNSNENDNSSDNEINKYTHTEEKRDKGFFRFKNFTLRHDLCGMKIGTDALLLAGYSSLFVSPYSEHVWNNTPFITPPNKNENSPKIENHNENINLNNNNDINNNGNNINCNHNNTTISSYNTDNSDKINIDNNDNNNIDNWPKRILDIGTGSGVISIMLLQSYSQALIDSVDINLDAIRQATCNIDSLPFDSWKKRIQVHHTPIQDYEPKQNNEVQHEIKYDLIVCAPPYFPSDPELDFCVKAMDEKRRLARHTHSLQMSELVLKVRELITPEKGKFKVILSLPHPASEFLETAKNVGLHCLERIYVRDNPKAKIIRFMDTYYLPMEKIYSHITSHTPKTKNQKHRSEKNNEIDVERDFSIYQKSFKEQPHVHRIYTNQYKWLLSDLCVHIFKEDDYYTSKPQFSIKSHDTAYPFRFEYLPFLQYLS